MGVSKNTRYLSCFLVNFPPRAVKQEEKELSVLRALRPIAMDGKNMAERRPLDGTVSKDEWHLQPRRAFDIVSSFMARRGSAQY